MPRPTRVTLSSQTTSAPIPVNWRAENFGVGFGCVIPSGTLTYKVEHTFDDIYDSSITPTWFSHASVYDKTGNADGNYAYPVRAIRLNVTAFTSGSVTMTVLQND